MVKFLISHVQEANSSNTYLKKLAIETACDEGTVIMADFQSKGRGQRGNNWHSDKGLNLLISILLEPGIDVGHFFSITTMTSLAILDLLEEQELHSSVKWPNDIYIQDDKIAGLLIENSLLGNKITQSILGIGLNVNQQNFPEWIPNPTSMSKVLNREFQIYEVLESLLSKLAIRYAQVKEGEFSKLLDEYNTRLYMKGMLRNFKTVSGNFKARIAEVGPKGDFVLLLDSGKTESFLFGEIQFLC